MEKVRANIRVNGIVQGVGFRPFIHKQISDHSLLGWIRNTSSGAEIEIEGTPERVQLFLEELWTKAPKLALIETVDYDMLPDLKHYTEFEIIQSKTEAERNTLISPDVCICDDCLAELRDPKNRRYRYPFINCTNCGPRFTIIKDVPYDRPKTTMGSFPMCVPCDREYHEITDRRYHAQPTCCPDCGPQLQYYGADGTLLADGRDLDWKNRAAAYSDPAEPDPVKLAAADLAAGKIVAVKGLGGIHLACRFDDPKIPAELRKRKHRDEKPFAVMCADARAARRRCAVSPAEARILESFRRPIVLLRKHDRASLPQISENAYVGVMLPYTPVHYLLFDELERYGVDSLVMTSANLSDLPILYRNSEAFEKLRGIADAFLLNDRDIHVRCDDSLMYVVNGSEYPLRRSRGYVPFPVTSFKPLPPILACGAEQKASFCLSKGRYVFPSQHIGDLKNIETYENYIQQIDHFERLYDIRPELAVCDLHPDYLSTQYAEESGLPVLKVQHHFAHMASCMADNRLDEAVIGIVWDGTGLGTDGTIWGAEFFTGDYGGFVRRGSIWPISLPGGDRVTHEIWRTGLSLLLDAGEDPEYAARSGGSSAEAFSRTHAAQVKTQLSLGLNCPRASSMGRLFDGVSAILGIRTEASYEGQGAILLEAAAADSCERVYNYILEERGGMLVFDWRPVIRQICTDLKDAAPQEVIAASFMNTLVAMAAETAERIAEDTGLHKAVLSGGSFQNMYMLARLPGELEKRGIMPYIHNRVAANDEGLSLGQLMIAERKMR